MSAPRDDTATCSDQAFSQIREKDREQLDRIEGKLDYIITALNGERGGLFGILRQQTDTMEAVVDYLTGRPEQAARRAGQRRASVPARARHLRAVE